MQPVSHQIPLPLSPREHSVSPSTGSGDGGVCSSYFWFSLSRAQWERENSENRHLTQMPGRSNRYYELLAKAIRCLRKRRNAGQKPANEALHLQSQYSIDVALPIVHCIRHPNTVHLRNFFFFFLKGQF
ncbi:hypothetical protein AB205_0022620 [Aquarana catesbeiana]|uniref:Uncharacterized protein n=1 Tax=Aquarana catesbeiana TaxID=8400 RepID=A0A2G9SIQ0_AQUCT|nr:hypothetical protein AB205_0022620 [Aquarana catesbeiana]